jgi:hypothetical protein
LVEKPMLFLVPYSPELPINYSARFKTNSSVVHGITEVITGEEIKR